MDHADLEGLVVVAAQHVLHRGDVDGRVLLRALLPPRASAAQAHTPRPTRYATAPSYSTSYPPRLLYEPLLRAGSFLIQLDTRGSLALSLSLSLSPPQQR